MKCYHATENGFSIQHNPELDIRLRLLAERETQDIMVRYASAFNTVLADLERSMA